MALEVTRDFFLKKLTQLVSFYVGRLPNFRGKRKILLPLQGLLFGIPVRSKYGVDMKLDVADRTNWYGATAGYGRVVADEISRLREGDCFIDVGSNCGVFSLLARQYVGSTGLVIAFEPCFTTFAKLVANIQHNGYENIIPFNLCVTDKSEVLKLEQKTGHSGKCAVSTSSAMRGQFAAGISLADFEGLIAIIGRRRTLVKVDVEGYEFVVLQGLAPVLSRPETKCVVVEIDRRNLSKYGAAINDVYDHLQSRGFSAPGPRGRDAHFDEVFSR